MVSSANIFRSSQKEKVLNGSVKKQIIESNLVADSGVLFIYV